MKFSRGIFSLRGQAGTIVLLLILLVASSLVIMNWNKSRMIQNTKSDSDAPNAVNLPQKVRDDLEKTQRDSLKRIEQEQKKALEGIQ